MQDNEVTEDLLTPKKENLNQQKNPRRTMKNSTKIVLIVLAAAIAVGAMVCVYFDVFNMLFGKKENKNTGNTNANLVKSGLFKEYGDPGEDEIAGGSAAQSGDWTYFCGGSKFYKTNGKVTKKVNLGSDDCASLNIYKGWIYYLSGNSHDGAVVARKRLSGGDPQILGEGGSRMFVYKNKIYLVKLTISEDYELEDVEIDAMDLDGKNRKKIYSNINLNYDTVSIDDDKIYYLDESDNSFYKLDLDGSHQTKVLDLATIGCVNNDGDITVDTSSMYVEGQRLFYIDTNQFGVYDLKTKKVKKFKASKGDYINNVNHDADFKHYYAISETFGEDDGDEDDYVSGRYHIWQFDVAGGHAKELYTYKGKYNLSSFLYVNDNGLFVQELNGTFKMIDPKTGEATTIYKYHTN